MKPRVLLVPLILWFASCKDSPPEPPPPSAIALAVEDASCTEAWLKVSSTAVPATVALTRDGHRVSVTRLLFSDSLLIDEGLLPKHTYTYQAVRLNADSTAAEASAPVQATTMDTTSHNFTWHIDTLGVTSSVLYDVAIINDTLAYAVGEIYLRDSTGQVDPLPYNLAVWNGRRWDIKRLNYRGSPPVIRFVFAISERDIWLDPWFHWDGQRFNEIPINPVFIGVGWNEMWGSSDGQLYVVGNSGAIAYSPDRGSTWQRVESGTTLPLNDVYGARNEQTGRYEILCVSEDETISGRSKILSIENTGVRVVATHAMWDLWGIWFVPGRLYVLGDDYVWWSHASHTGWAAVNNLPSLFSTCVRGNGLNDFTVGGAFWLLAHWNGATWQTYFPRTSGSFTKVQMKGNLIIAVGGVGNKAIAAQGRR